MSTRFRRRCCRRRRRCRKHATRRACASRRRITLLRNWLVTRPLSFSPSHMLLLMPPATDATRYPPTISFLRPHQTLKEVKPRFIGGFIHIEVKIHSEQEFALHAADFLELDAGYLRPGFVGVGVTIKIQGKKGEITEKKEKKTHSSKNLFAIISPATAMRNSLPFCAGVNRFLSLSR